MNVIRIINKEELSKPDMFLPSGTKLKLNLYDKTAEKFIHLGKDFLTLEDWNDYDYGMELDFKEGTYCYLKDIESIEILED